MRCHPCFTLFPYTTLFRSGDVVIGIQSSGIHSNGYSLVRQVIKDLDLSKEYGLGETLGEAVLRPTKIYAKRSEEHTSELQSRGHLVCRLLLEKKKTMKKKD